MSSSFKRKPGNSKQTTLPSGTQSCPSSLLTVLTSTGIPSLDDILGGGLPQSCSLLVLAPDHHSLYGELVQKYFIAQGLACGHDVWVVDDAANDLVRGCMWTVPGTTASADTTMEDEEDENSPGDKIKIAWRYAQAGKFQTTVSTPTSSNEEYCQKLDLACRIPGQVVDAALHSGQLTCLGVSSASEELGVVAEALHRIEERMRIGDMGSQEKTLNPLRICIPSLGSPQWGDLSSQDVMRFLLSLRRLLHRHPHACASISLPAHLSSNDWGGDGWIQKLSWLSDASITLAAFSGDPSLSATFPTHHGLLHLHSLPAPHTLLPPSDKFSALRGLSASASSGRGENNLAFKCTRKRLVFETCHLDLDGGVSERRTTPSGAAAALNASISSASGADAPNRVVHRPAAVDVKGSSTRHVVVGGADGGKAAGTTATTKRKVAFQSDRPDLYDF